MSLEWKSGRPTLAYPLKRLTKVTVELASVDYGVQVAPESAARTTLTQAICRTSVNTRRSRVRRFTTCNVANDATDGFRQRPTPAHG
jgi:hypothetical protein